MKKSLTIEDLKERIGKPIFAMNQNRVKSIFLPNGWNILTNISEEPGEKLGEEPYKCLHFISGLSYRYHDVTDFRFFDIEVSEEELAEILASEKKEKKKTGYERVPKEKYYSVSSRLESINHYDDAFNFDDEKYNIANYFNNNPLCENIARAERLKYQLRRFAALNGGIPSVEDWVGNNDNWKYFIAYDYGNQKTYINSTFKYKTFGQIYFKNQDACKKAIEIFKDELLWYFTEFKEMLY